MKITDEAVEAALDSACLSYRHDFGLLPEQDRETLRRTAKWWLEAWQKALPHLSQGAGEKEGEPSTDAEAKDRLAEIIAKNPEDFGPGTNPLGDTSAALPHMGGVKAAIQNSVLYQCTICADIYPEGSCHPSDSVWALGDKVLCENCLGEESEGESAIRVDKIVASHEPAPTNTQEVLEVVAWRSRGPKGGWLYREEPYDNGCEPLVRLSDYEALRAENERLRIERITAERDAADYMKRLNKAAGKLSIAENVIAELVKALEFYADVSKYPSPLTGGMGALWQDCGQRARNGLEAALKGQSNE